MSQLKVDTITDEAGTGSPSLPNGLTVGGVNYPSTGPLSNRNKIINGDMRIDQRNAGAAVTPAAIEYTLDRWRLFMLVGSKLTAQRVTDAPAGFTYSAKITVAASYTPSASDQFFFGTAFEADNVGDLGFGTAAAQTTTLSFWVKSSVTGTYSFSWTNNANDLSYVDSFIISSADTWEKKTFTIAGDTTGTWPNTGNGRHSFLQVSLGAGSNFNGTAGSWQSGNLRQTSGSVNFVAQSNGATFYITGVQLEAGTVATPFEHRSFGQELALCERYFQKVDYNHANGGAAANWYVYNIGFPSRMRAAPSLAAATAYNSDTGSAVMRQGGSFINGWVLESASQTSASVRGSNTSLSQALEGRGWFSAEL
jgi:hypothetical protein